MRRDSRSIVITHDYSSIFKVYLKKNLNASRPSEHSPVRGGMSKRLDGIIGCKYKTSLWNLNGFSDGINSNNIGSTV